MFYSGELKFLCKTLLKGGIQVRTASPDTAVKDLLGNSMMFILKDYISAEKTVSDLITEIEPNTLYKLSGIYNFCYIYFRLPQSEEDSILVIGPYFSSPITAQKIAEMSAVLKLPPISQNILEKFCAGVPVIRDSNPFFIMIDAFCEHIWGATYSVVDVNKEAQMPVSPINQLNENENTDDILFRIELIEKRYKYENEILQAVTLGQMNKADQLFSMFSELSFEKRLGDPLRNMKNYCIITNTLLRKAAEDGGVHPIYIDSISSDFAIKIEQINSISDIGAMMRNMFRSYCRLVRKHSMKDYSPLIQNTIIYIESDLSANLSLSIIADALKVSAGYLSTAFKRETGKTLTEFIREKRIKHATHLLNSTHLQIQTVALNCGIMDLQYFSKLFKRHTGMTPKEYRDSIK